MCIIQKVSGENCMFHRFWAVDLCVSTDKKHKSEMKHMKTFD